jgi:hypothetical protein
MWWPRRIARSWLRTVPLDLPCVDPGAVKVHVLFLLDVAELSAPMLLRSTGLTSW